MPRALILSYHFYPSCEVGAKRVSELARQLRDSGWEVTTVSAPADVVEELAERIGDMEVIHVTPPRKLYPRVAGLVRKWGRAGDREVDPVHAAAGASQAARESWLGALRRNYNALEWTLDDSKWWAWAVALRAVGLRRRWDWIISSGPPVSVHVAARFLAGWTGARWLMDLRDPWVGNEFWPAHVRSRTRDLLERRLEAGCVRRADRITVASPGIGRALAGRHPEAASRVEVVLNGYDGKAARSSAARGRLRLLYAGSLYFNRDPFPLLEAFGALVRSPGVDRSRVGFTLVGNCAKWNGRSLQAWVDAAGLGDCVRILPPVSPAAVREMMGAAEVLVNFAQGQRDQIPAKLYDYIASKREMLLIAEQDSDAARVTRESGCGRVVAPDDLAGLHKVLEELHAFYVVRRAAYKPAGPVIRSFSRAHQNSRFMALLAMPSAGS